MISLMIIPYLLPVTNLKKKGKPSKIEVQESFICHYKNLSDADNGHREFLDQYEGNIQPRMVLVGTPLEISKVYVAHMSYVFEGHYIKESVETCMNIFLGLNIKYPTESSKVWYYVQKYIFKINTPYDYTDTATETLFNDLISSM